MALAQNQALLHSAAKDMLYAAGMALGKRLAEARKKAKLTQAEVGDAVGVSSQAVSQWERDLTMPELEKIPLLARKLQVSEGWLVAAETPAEAAEAEPLPDRVVRVVGYVGAGAEAHFYAVSQGDLDEVPAPQGVTENTVAVEIRGDSLGSFFDKWLVFYDDVRRPVTVDLVGRLCVVGLETGQILVKKLRRSRLPGLFNLESEHAPPITDVAVEWAARVKGMAPR